MPDKGEGRQAMTRLARIAAVLCGIGLACACIIRLIERSERHERDWALRKPIQQEVPYAKEKK